jgi:chromosome segregation ATPase
MRQGIARMDIKQRLKAHRTLSLILTFLTLVGWGAFAYSAGSSSIATRDLRAEIAQLKASQDQLLAERNQQQAAAGDLAQTQAKLASAREDLDILAHKREQARAQVAAAQQELMVLTKRREEKQAKGSEKGKVQAVKPSGKPARLAAQTKHQT